jgi:hypothetical protein
MYKKHIAAGVPGLPIYSKLTSPELEQAVPTVHIKPDSYYISQLVTSAGAGWLDQLEKVMELLGKEKMGVLLKVSYKSRTAFHAACGKNQIAVMDFIYSTFGYDLEKNCGSGVTPLFSAVASQSKEAAVWLLRHGAKKDRPAKCGLSPIDVAVERNLSEMLNILNAY